MDEDSRLSLRNFWKRSQLDAKSPLQTKAYDIIYQKLRNNRYQNFLFLSNFALFLNLISNILSKRVDTYLAK